MQGRTEDGFYARFLGGFSLYYKEREIKVGMGLRSRPAQCLLLLLKAGDAGVERKELLGLVRTVGDDQKRQLNNLYQHMHVLRDALPGLGLPEGRYIVLRQGRYYFTMDHRVATDIGRLDDLIRQLRAEGLNGPTRRELCMAYCRGYGGEMLPQLAGEGWVTIEAAFYQRWYSRCLEELCSDLKAGGRYEKILELCQTASQLHPYDGWQVRVLESLLAMGRYKEAEQAYRDAVRLFDGGPGSGPLDQVMARYRQTPRRVSFGASALVGLGQGLAEEDVGAPYYCSYPSFQDIYRIVARMGERQEGKVLLLLCTLRGQPLRAAHCGTASRGEGPPDGIGLVAGEWAEASSRAAARKALEQEMARLEQVLEDGLRACDVYTRYSRNQYLGLLTGAGPEDAERILARLEQGWRMAGGRDMCLELAAEGIEDHSEEGAGDGEGDFCGAYQQSGKRHLAGAGHLAG